MRADKSLKPFEIRLYRHYRVVHGVRIALAFVLTFLLVRLLNVPEGTWPLITLVVVMGPISFWGNVVPRALPCRWWSGRRPAICIPRCGEAAT